MSNLRDKNGFEESFLVSNQIESKFTLTLTTGLVWGPFLEIPGNLPGPIIIFLNVFSPITQ